MSEGEAASGPITEIIAPCRMEYSIAAGEAQRPFLRGLAEGRILAQRSIMVNPDDTAESLSSRVHKIEHELLIEVIGQFAREKEEKS